MNGVLRESVQQEKGNDTIVGTSGHLDVHDREKEGDIGTAKGPTSGHFTGRGDFGPEIGKGPQLCTGELHFFCLRRLHPIVPTQKEFLYDTTLPRIFTGG